MEIFLGIGLRWVLRFVIAAVIGLASVLQLFGFGAAQYLYESNILFFLVLILLLTFSRRNSGTKRWFFRFIAINVFVIAICIQFVAPLLLQQLYAIPYYEIPVLQLLWNTKWFFAPCILFLVTFVGRAPRRVLLEVSPLPELTFPERDKK